MNINDAKRIVFKFGTNVLRNDDREISLSRVYSFIEEISSLPFGAPSTKILSTSKHESI